MRVADAADSDFVFVNLFRGKRGAPMRPDAIGELMAAASRRAGLDVAVRAHQLRHTSQRSCVSFNLTVPTGCSMLSGVVQAAAFNEYRTSTTALDSNRADDASVDSEDRQT
jgi:integrase